MKYTNQTYKPINISFAQELLLVNLILLGIISTIIIIGASTLGYLSTNL